MSLPSPQPDQPLLSGTPPDVPGTFLSHMLDAVPALASYIDKDTRYQYTNRAYEDWFNQPRATVIGKTMRDVLGTDAFELIREHVERALAGEQVTYETHIPYQSGGGRYVHATYVPRRDPAGVVEGFFAFVVDVTPLKQAEQQARLRDRERFRLAAIVDSSTDAIIAKTLDGTITDWNAGAEQVFGYAANEMLGRPITTIIPPERIDEEAMILDRLKRGERIDHYETVRVRKGGRRIDVSLSISPVRDASGKVIGVSKIARDITEQKRGAATLRQQEQRLAAIFSSAAVGVAVMTPDARYLQVNDAFCEIVGYPREELLRMDCRTLTHADDLDTMARLLESLRAGAIPSFVLEKRFIRKDGTAIWSQNSVSLTRDSTGEPTHLVVLCQDITARKRAEEQIIASLHEKEVLLKEIHHRVKNNLQIISSLLNLQSDSLADPAMVSRFEESKNRIHSMALVHEQLYRTSDLSTIRMDLYTRSLVEQLFRSFGEPEHVLLEVHADEAGLNLDTAIPCGLMLNEMISNALKHAFPEQRRGRILVSLELIDGSRCRITVGDDGVGLPAEFDLASTESLGLRLIHTLADQLRGTVSLRRTGGTAFVIDFPLVAHALAEPPESP